MATKNRTPSPAQLAARAKFAAMQRARKGKTRKAAAISPKSSSEIAPAVKAARTRKRRTRAAEAKVEAVVEAVEKMTAQPKRRRSSSRKATQSAGSSTNSGPGPDFFSQPIGGNPPIVITPPSYSGSYNGQRANTAGQGWNASWLWQGGATIGGAGGHWGWVNGYPLLQPGGGKVYRPN